MLRTFVEDTNLCIEIFPYNDPKYIYSSHAEYFAFKLFLRSICHGKNKYSDAVLRKNFL